ncbi:MAG: O-antigen ligase family protein [Candidatus Kerfeldbacteria bacterium]|nr:O-antigen ligase family protein [Candidatus Kerfeldbacteria bacterium]
MIAPSVVTVVLIVFAVVAFRWPRYAVAGLVVGAPAYLLRSTLVGYPTTALEAGVLGTVAGWLAGIVARQSFGNVVAQLRLIFDRPLIVALAVTVTGWLVATAASINLPASLGALKAWLVEPLLISLIVVHEFRTSADQRLLRTALLAALLWVSVVGLVQLATFRSTVEGGRLSSVFAPVANYLAMFIVPLLVLAVGWWLQRQAWWLSGISAVLGAAALLLSFSFGGYLALVAGLLVLAIRLLDPIRRRRPLMLITVVGGLLLLILSPTHYLREKLNFVTRSSSLVRTQIWRTAVEVGREHPLLGIGPNTFEQAYRATVPRLYFPPLEWLVAKPHNLYLNLWLETGVLGLIGTLWLLGLCLRRMWGQPAGSVYAAAIISILAHGLVDTPLFKNDLALLAAVIIALGLLSATSPTQN